MNSTPPSGSAKIERVAANEETTVLTPVTDGDAAIDRTPVPDGAPAIARIPGSRQKMWIIIAAVSVALLIVAIIVVVHLRNVSLEWEAQVNAVKVQNYDLGTSLAGEQTQVVDLESANEQITSQLQTAQQKILELADEKAQQGDNVEFYARQIDDLTTELASAASVANSLDRCIDGKTQLVGYLKEPANYDAVEVADFETSLKIKCDNAVAANVDLQRILAQ